MSDLYTEIAGEAVNLLPERGMFWGKEETLFITDPHIGKIASLRARGSVLPGGSTTADLRRLSELVGRTRARRLVVLGDLYHARAGRLAVPTSEAFKRWRDDHAGLHLTLVPGNHDASAGLPMLDLEIEIVQPGHAVGPFRLRHDPAAHPGGYALSGHLHPGVLLRGPGGERLRLPCFWVRPDYAVLPAFGSTTGLKTIDPVREDRLFAIVEDEVMAL